MERLDPRPRATNNQHMSLRSKWMKLELCATNYVIRERDFIQSIQGHCLCFQLVGCDTKVRIGGVERGRSIRQ